MCSNLAFPYLTSFFQQCLAPTYFVLTVPTFMYEPATLSTLQNSSIPILLRSIAWPFACGTLKAVHHWSFVTDYRSFANSTHIWFSASCHQNWQDAFSAIKKIGCASVRRGAVFKSWKEQLTLFDLVKRDPWTAESTPRLHVNGHPGSIHEHDQKCGLKQWHQWLVQITAIAVEWSEVHQCFYLTLPQFQCRLSRQNALDLPKIS